MSVRKTVRKTLLKTVHTAPSGSPNSSSGVSGPLVKPGKPTRTFRRHELNRSAHIDIFAGEDHPVQRIPLSYDLKGLVIGREECSDVHVPFSNASRKHAQIIVRNEEFVVEDMGSTNGTLVNGIKVNRCVLRDGDQIRVGDAIIVFTQPKKRT